MKRRRQAVIKGSSLPALRIVVRDGDAHSLRTELLETIDNARPLLAEAIAVLDLRERLASDVDAHDIVTAVRDAGVRLAAVLIGDSLQAPGGDFIRKLIPPPPMLWAALGRLALPNLPDTVIRGEGTNVRADVGRPVSWRLTFHGDSLVRVERVDGDRVLEWVDRTDPKHVSYRNTTARRSLVLTITRMDEVSSFDASIWRLVP